MQIQLEFQEPTGIDIPKENKSLTANLCQSKLSAPLAFLLLTSTTTCVRRSLETINQLS